MECKSQTDSNIVVEYTIINIEYCMHERPEIRLRSDMGQNACLPRKY